jgi:Ribosomal protein L4
VAVVVNPGDKKEQAGLVPVPSDLHCGKGGGVIFAPKSRDYSKKVNKKVKALAMKSVFSAKAQENELRVLNQLVMDAPKTKEMIGCAEQYQCSKSLDCTSRKQRSNYPFRKQYSKGCNNDGQ